MKEVPYVNHIIVIPIISILMVILEQGIARFLTAVGEKENNV